MSATTVSEIDDPSPYLAPTPDAPSLLPAQTRFDPQLVCYLAGVDPYEHDRLGGLKLTREGLEQRDRDVFDRFAERGIPRRAAGRRLCPDPPRDLRASRGHRTGRRGSVYWVAGCETLPTVHGRERDHPMRVAHFWGATGDATRSRSVGRPVG